MNIPKLGLQLLRSCDPQPSPCDAVFHGLPELKQSTEAQIRLKWLEQLSMASLTALGNRVLVGDDGNRLRLGSKMGASFEEVM